MNVFAKLDFPFVSSLGPRCGKTLSTLKLIWIFLLTNAQRLVSLIIGNHLKVTIKITHHIIFQELSWLWFSFHQYRASKIIIVPILTIH